MLSCAGFAFFNRCSLLREAISAIENSVAAVSSPERRCNESAVSVVFVMTLAPSGTSVTDSNITPIIFSLWRFHSSLAVKRACVTYIQLADL